MEASLWGFTFKPSPCLETKLYNFDSSILELVVGSTFVHLWVNFRVNFMYPFFKEGGFQLRIHVMYAHVRDKGDPGVFLRHVFDFLECRRLLRQKKHLLYLGFFIIYLFLINQFSLFFSAYI